jgi:hypothetical protein
MDTEIATGRRYKALENAAALLNVDALVPSTKAPAVERELFMALLLEALAERVAKPKRQE